ncbi:hypothetical protein FOC4_g10000086 [Fusarium odoratissimum]|uniref:Uncharacterized protein n=2 Tax=Fusarium oxysporum species complex TaxID=171631 RepID=N1RVG8_FUSC4|nr:hypothetical protein FOC4_g10000084 [Fusarium odoratissimum]EMT69416.1 hypothetical protein FOC4_g10000086 [Fusarium odoratissimum]TXB98084.1 hypothetical protein FocTR4_00017041 [Fusarium oxysporum f. sp. cubense]
MDSLVLGSQSPFVELFSLFVFCRAIAGSETPALLARAESLCEQLMYSWKPLCGLSSVKDDMANTTHGLSFVNHPKNVLAETYLELSLKACTNQVNPLSRKGRWNQKEILAYLNKEKALREILSGLMLMTCGGQPCIPDLLNIRVCNHRTSERSLYVYNGYMIYVTRSHKAKRSINREFVVARFLPSQVGHLMYTHIVYIRPFVDMLAREQLLRINGCSPFSFRSRSESDSPSWSTERLSNTVRRFTQEVWDKELLILIIGRSNIPDKDARR